MKFSSIKERLAGLGGAKWEVHARAKAMAREGRDVIRLTIGEPDVPTPERLKEAAFAAMQAWRAGSAAGVGGTLQRNAGAGVSSRSGDVLSGDADRALCGDDGGGGGGLRGAGGGSDVCHL